MLVIITKCQHTYYHENVTRVRLAKRELRWVNARGEDRSMGLCFIADWQLSELR